MIGEMATWRQDDITELLDIAESSLRACVVNLNLTVSVLRKDRAVGVYPQNKGRLSREQLEETVLVVQNTVERSSVGSRLPFCAFNGTFPPLGSGNRRSSTPSKYICMLIHIARAGGNDVFVDIGDKSWGVRACQQYFGNLSPAQTLHVGDQFLSAGANDFKVCYSFQFLKCMVDDVKARLASTTAWIASPAETVQLLDELDCVREVLS